MYVRVCRYKHYIIQELRDEEKNGGQHMSRRRSESRGRIGE